MYIWLMMTLYFATIVFYTLEKFLTFFAWKTYEDLHEEDHDELKSRKQSYADQHKEHSIAISARTLGSLSLNNLKRDSRPISRDFCEHIRLVRRILDAELLITSLY